MIEGVGREGEIERVWTQKAENRVHACPRVCVRGAYTIRRERAKEKSRVIVAGIDSWRTIRNDATGGRLLLVCDGIGRSTNDWFLSTLVNVHRGLRTLLRRRKCAHDSWYSALH